MSSFTLEPFHRFLPPGTPRFAAWLSSTSTQSFASGGVKLRLPVVGKTPIRVVFPSRGLNHEHMALDFASVILVISIVIVAVPFGYRQ